MQTVLSTATFARQAKAAGLSDAELLELEGVLSANPLAGELIVGTGGARKLRLAGKGKGKSGGYRTIHYYAGDDVPVFLLAVLSKGDRANISKAERNELAKVLPTLADAYKAAMKAKEKRK